MSFREDLIAVAESEWKRFGYSQKGLAGERVKIVGTENKAPYVNYINEYWRVVGQPTWTGLTDLPWSAAFISFCFERAGAGAQFPYNAAHADYCSAIVRKPVAYPGLSVRDPASHSPQPGDLVVAARTKHSPQDYGAAMAELNRGTFFPSHADIVVERGQHWIEVIGGNVSNSVTRVRYGTDSAGIVRDARAVWIGVLEVNL